MLKSSRPLKKFLWTTVTTLLAVACNVRTYTGSNISSTVTSEAAPDESFKSISALASSETAYTCTPADMDAVIIPPGYDAVRCSSDLDNNNTSNIQSSYLIAHSTRILRARFINKETKAQEQFFWVTGAATWRYVKNTSVDKDPLAIEAFQTIYNQPLPLKLSLVLDKVQLPAGTVLYKYDANTSEKVTPVTAVATDIAKGESFSTAPAQEINTLDYNKFVTCLPADQQSQILVAGYTLVQCNFTKTDGSNDSILGQSYLTYLVSTKSRVTGATITRNNSQSFFVPGFATVRYLKNSAFLKTDSKVIKAFQNQFGELPQQTIFTVQEYRFPVGTQLYTYDRGDLVPARLL